MSFRCKNGYCSGTTENVNAAVLDMWAHDGPGVHDVTEFVDPKHLWFGWECTCGERWVFQLLPFKHSGIGSRFREEMSTSDGRRKLVWSYRGAWIPRQERRE